MFTNIASVILEKEASAAGIAAVVSKSDSPEQLLAQARAIRP